MIKAWDDNSPKTHTMTTTNSPRALVAMSGGVDSSVAAYLAQQAGFDCLGCTMALCSSEGSLCCSVSDVDDARSAAWRLGMRHYVFNFRAAFDHCVVDNFVSAYESGLTPNPCVECNRRLKFDVLLRRAAELDIPCLVTGHYARIERSIENNGFVLKKAIHADKDQSYFLYMMTQEQLARVAFPVGALRKAEVRAIAASLGLRNADKRESQDICFVPDGDYAAFIERYRGSSLPEGDFIDFETGRVLGRHRGQARYTIGQRKGLPNVGHPIFVLSRDAAKNTVTVGREEHLYSRSLVAADFNWIGGAPHGPVRVQAKTRYRQAEQPAEAEAVTETAVRLTFDTPQKAIAPGQSVVLYDNDTVLGGGVIKQ
ncbi:MAG: tRNA 2-thiouridine(34) synthase MnmA [Synergistaceae bacterium]|jgi:tRNA-specific 2-thiouridylase|nr:tRNA 2-thiouridine(34) synthase MnmA [Synergistaceae bacterium]